jgi:phage/plasmid-associated DNA primase
VCIDESIGWLMLSRSLLLLFLETFAAAEDDDDDDCDDAQTANMVYLIH